MVVDVKNPIEVVYFVGHQGRISSGSRWNCVCSTAGIASEWSVPPQAANANTMKTANRQMVAIFIFDMVVSSVRFLFSKDINNEFSTQLT